ncbi:MAG: PQQ-binding-like beta-propeller repeat protein [Methylocapsa sp.]|nr:PQQ-binding-like beta-propeller repeat protein [Methylocapsa sp.]
MPAICNSFISWMFFSLILLVAARAQEWPAYRHENQRTGVQPFPSNLSNPKFVGSLTVEQSFPKAGDCPGAWFCPVGAFQASPIVVNDTVFIGDENGYFYALDAATLVLKWRYPPKGHNGLKAAAKPFAYGIGAAAAFWGGVRPNGAVIFAAQDPSLGGTGKDGRLFALDAAAGNFIANWPSSQIAEIDNNNYCDKIHFFQRIQHSSPLIFNNKAYAGIQSFEAPVQVGQVAAVNLTTGQKDPSFNFLAVIGGGSLSKPVLGGGVWDAPASDGTDVYFTTGNVRTDACSPGPPPNVNPQPAHNHGLSMIRVDKNTGGVKWELQPVPFKLDYDPDWAAGAAVMKTKNCGELVASVQKDGWSYAADAATGTCRWQFPPVNPPITEPKSACTWTGYSQFNPNVASPWNTKHGPNGYRQPGAVWNNIFIVVAGGEALIHDEVSAGYPYLHALDACAKTEQARVRWIAPIPEQDFKNGKAGDFSLSAATLTGGIAIIGTDGGHLLAFGDPSVVGACGTICSDVDFGGASSACPPPYVSVPKPQMLADVVIPDGGNIAYFHKEAVLAKGRVFVATDRGHVYMLEAPTEVLPVCH